MPPSAAQGARADTLARREPAVPRAWHEQPRFVMLRSLVVPGWGQLHNRSWLKALGVAGAEGWLGTAILRDGRELDDLLAEVNAAAAAQDVERHTAAVNRYNDRLDAYVGRQWMLAGLLTYALVDAYVDAHFRSFDIEFRHDPALPDGPPGAPAATSGGGVPRTAGARLALRWRF